MKHPEDPKSLLSEEDLLNLLRSRSWHSSRSATSCPDEGEVAAFAEGRLPDSTRDRFEEHLAVCESCLGTAAILLRLRDSEAIEVPPDLRRRAVQLLPGHRQPWWHRQWRVALPAAAGLILAVGVVVFQQDSGPPALSPQKVPFGGEANSVRLRTYVPDALRILAPAEGAVVDPYRADLHWTAASQGLFYEVQVISDDGDLVWKGRTEEVEMRLPAEAGLDPGREYFLWVRAYLPDGKTLKSSAVGFKVVQEEQGADSNAGR